MIVFSAALLYFCEQGEWDARQKLWLYEDGEPTPFDSMPSTAWWAMATITTVGYGDITPVTDLQRGTQRAVRILPLLRHRHHFERPSLRGE